jgi:hypothetical protein
MVKATTLVERVRETKANLFMLSRCGVRRTMMYPLSDLGAVACKSWLLGHGRAGANVLDVRVAR